MTLTPAQIVSELSVLRATWSTTRAASGGFAAMAGFDFQLNKALCAIIRRAYTGDGSAFVEVLSDILEADEGVLITQAKRTLSSAALHSALSELWQIYRLAKAKTPELCKHLRFQVASEKKILGDWEASMARWSPDEVDADDLRGFKRLVSVSVTPQPRFEAARLLIRDYKDPEPFARIDRMLGRLLGGTAETLDTIVEEFRIELQAQREAARDRERSFELWGSDDRAPERTVFEGDERYSVRLGERLSIEDLRDGRLAPRRIYDAIETHCERWLVADREPYKLPAYWLSGRSGCGKSAALLHLAARLHAQNPDRIILYLGEQAHRIAEAVRWAGPLLREGRSIVLLLDDPYTAARQIPFTQSVEEAQREWEQVRIDIPADERRPPVILCCGPTEQRAAAEDNCGAHIACDGFDLPIESQEDLDELAEWYAVRTGKTVASMEGNILLVQQVFEWTKGSIADFSRRFRQRIEGFDGRKDGPTFSAVTQILALNRLYVEFPASQLVRMRDTDPALDAALITLGEAESHLEFSHADRGGVRLTHPHLANAIYTEWFSRDAHRPYRKRHLEAALGAALDQPDAPPEIRHAPLWAIGRLALVIGPSAYTPDPAMQARIDLIRPELCEVLAQIYVRQSTTDTPLEDLPVWIALRDHLGLAIAPDPVPLLIAAVDQASEPARGLRLSCHRLLGAIGDGDSAKASVAACLNRLATWRDYGGGWHDWVPLAMDYVERHGAEPIADSIDQIVRSGTALPGLSQLLFMTLDRTDVAARSIAIDWLQQNRSSVAGWVPMLENLQARGHCEQTDAIALRFLAAAREDPAWPYVWRNLLEAGRIDRARLIEDGFAWIGLGRQAGDTPLPEHLGWDRVWKWLLAEQGAREPERARLIAAGRQWIADVDPDHNGWTWVWQELWASPEARMDPSFCSELATVAEIKLDLARTDLEGWSHVWKAVLVRADADMKPFLLRMGVQWIREVPSVHPGWGYVWEELFLNGGPSIRTELKERARQWLALVDVDHISWAYVWRNAVSSPLDPADPLVLRALDCLRFADPEMIAWPRTALALLSLGDGTVAAEARRLAFEWLSAHMSLPIAGGVCRACLDLGREDEAAATFAAHCLATVQDQSASPWERGLAWDVVRQTGDAEPLLGRVALELLDDPNTPVEVQYNVCGRGVRSRMGRDQSDRFISHGCRLLEMANSDKSWFWLWEGMKAVGAAEKARVLEAARQRLIAVGPRNPHWDKIYFRARALDPAFGKNDVIQDQLKGWLAAETASPRWVEFWTCLDDRVAALDDPGLWRAAEKVLNLPLALNLWVSLLRATLDRSPPESRAAVVEMAGTKLSSLPLSRDWARIWSRMYQEAGTSGANREWLERIAFERLTGSPAGDGWYWLWRAARHHVAGLLGKPEVRDAATLWFGEGSAQIDHWIEVWRWRAKYDPSPWTDRDARRQITTWLRVRFSVRGQWSTAWTCAARALSGRQSDELQTMGFDWLREASPKHGGWTYIWLTLWALNANRPSPRERLRGMGETWLRLGIAGHQTALVATRVRD